MPGVDTSSGSKASFLGGFGSALFLAESAVITIILEKLLGNVAASSGTPFKPPAGKFSHPRCSPTAPKVLDIRGKRSQPPVGPFQSQCEAQIVIAAREGWMVETWGEGGVHTHLIGVS